MRFLICGLGSIGRRHLRNLITLGEKDIVLYRSGKSTLPDDELNGFPTESNLARALARWVPDAVIVSNPTALHLEVALPAAKAGCALLLEKPISHSMQGVDTLQRELEANRRQALVGFQFRFHPGLQQLKSWLEEGAIGGPISVRVHWGEYLPGWHPWEDYRDTYTARKDLGGGVVLTLCHPLDYLRWLLGEVVGVSAELGYQGLEGLDVENTAEILLRFDQGALGSVHLDYNQRPASHSLQIVGSAGSMRWSNETGVASLWTEQAGQWRDVRPPAGFERNTLFLNEMQHFIQVASGDQTPLCSLQDGMEALRIALAAKKSAAEGKRVVLKQGWI